jgi:hypothetical protein
MPTPQPPLHFRPHITRFHSRRLGWLWAAYYSRTDRLPFTTTFYLPTLTKFLAKQHAIHERLRA